MAATKTMTVSQALVEFLGHQWTVDGEHRERTIAGMFGIFGHGNVAGIGQALKQYNVDEPELMPYYQARSEERRVGKECRWWGWSERLCTEEGCGKRRW